MAFTLQDVSNKVFIGLGAVIILILVYLGGSDISMRLEMISTQSDLRHLTAQINALPGRKEIAEIAAVQVKDSYIYDKDRLNEKISEIKQELQNLSQYQREVQIKGFDDIRLMQIELKQLSTQFAMWRTIEEKRIKDQGGYDPGSKTYNVEDTTPPDLLHKPTLPKE